MAFIPRRYAPLVYGIFQAALTTGIATGIATVQATGLGLAFFAQWLSAWLLAWLTMLPVVVLLAPLIQRAVSSVTILDP